MSDEFTNSSCGDGGCASCGSDCGSCGGCGSDATQHRTISLTMEDDTQIEFAILTIYPLKEEEYIALLPLDENGQNHDGEVYLYGFTRTENGDPMLRNIESDEEYADAAAEFNRIVEKARKDEEMGVPLE